MRGSMNVPAPLGMVRRGPLYLRDFTPRRASVGVFECQQMNVFPTELLLGEAPAGSDRETQTPKDKVGRNLIGPSITRSRHNQAPADAQSVGFSRASLHDRIVRLRGPLQSTCLLDLLVVFRQPYRLAVRSPLCVWKNEKFLSCKPFPCS